LQSRNKTDRSDYRYQPLCWFHYSSFWLEIWW